MKCIVKRAEVKKDICVVVHLADVNDPTQSIIAEVAIFSQRAIDCYESFSDDYGICYTSLLPPELLYFNNLVFKYSTIKTSMGEIPICIVCDRTANEETEELMLVENWTPKNCKL